MRGSNKLIHIYASDELGRKTQITIEDANIVLKVFS